MSRIGKKPISFPKNVKISQNADVIKVEGPKGTLSSKLPEGINIKIDDGSISVERKIRRACRSFLPWLDQNADRQYGERRYHRL